MESDAVLERIRTRVADFQKEGVWGGPPGMETELMRDMTHLLELYDTQGEELWNWRQELEDPELCDE